MQRNLWKNLRHTLSPNFYLTQAVVLALVLSCLCPLVLAYLDQSHASFIVTADASAATMEACRKAPIEQVLLKPYTPEAVREIVEECPEHHLDKSKIAELKRLARGDVQFLHSILETAGQDMHHHLGRIERALHCADTQEIGFAAHALAGAASSVGARGLQGRSRAVHEQARGGRADRHQTERLGRIVRRSLVELKGELTSTS